MSLNNVDFVANDGALKGGHVVWNDSSILSHREKYSNQRPELNDIRFFDEAIPNTITRPDVIYPSIRCKNGRVRKFRQGCYVFYQQRRLKESTISIDGKVFIRYNKVVVCKQPKNVFLIKTAYISPNINEESRCKPVKKIL
jgi:hypothetical protein